MRAIVWQGPSEVGPIVRCLARAALSGQPVTVVTTLDRALAAVTRARAGRPHRRLL